MSEPTDDELTPAEREARRLRRQETREQIQADQRMGRKRDEMSRERERKWYRENRPNEKPPV